MIFLESSEIQEEETNQTADFQTFARLWNIETEFRDEDNQDYLTVAAKKINRAFQEKRLFIEDDKLIYQPLSPACQSRYPTCQLPPPAALLLSRPGGADWHKLYIQLEMSEYNIEMFSTFFFADYIETIEKTEKKNF